jgi:hypothetical protein
MFGKRKQTKAQRVVSVIDGAFDGSGGVLKAVGTAVGSVALVTVGASAFINNLRKKS